MAIIVGVSEGPFTSVGDLTSLFQALTHAALYKESVDVTNKIDRFVTTSDPIIINDNMLAEWLKIVVLNSYSQIVKAPNGKTKYWRPRGSITKLAPEYRTHLKTIMIISDPNPSNVEKLQRVRDFF